MRIQEFLKGFFYRCGIGSIVRILRVQPYVVAGLRSSSGSNLLYYLFIIQLSFLTQGTHYSILEALKRAQTSAKAGYLVYIQVQ